jgi:hypothetical protein
MPKKRAPPLTDMKEVVIARITALVKLETELAEAAAIERSDARGGTQKTIAAIHRFLCAAQVPHASRGCIIALAAALDALDQGKVLPLLKPSRKGKGHPVTEAEAIPRAVAAALLELRFQELKKVGDENALNNAAAWVARKIRHWVVLKPSTDPQRQTKLDQGRIKSWRAELTGKQDESPSTAVYDFLVAKAPSCTAKLLLKQEPAIWGVQIRKS